MENRQTKLFFRPDGNGNNSLMVQRPTNYTGFYTQWKFQAVSSKSLNNVNDTTELSASPNPAEDHVLITGTANANGTGVYSLDGSKVSSTISVESENSILVVFDESLSSGIYIVKTENGKSVKVVKK